MWQRWGRRGWDRQVHADCHQPPRMRVDFETYTEIVAARLGADGVRRLEVAPDEEAVAFGTRSLWLRQPGLVDIVCVVAPFEDPAIADIESFSARCFAFAREVGTVWPLGVGRSVAAISVAACRSASHRLERDIADYRPVHRGAIEFPVVVDLEAGALHYGTWTPTWRRGTGARLRRLAGAFDPTDTDLADLAG